MGNESPTITAIERAARARVRTIEMAVAPIASIAVSAGAATGAAAWNPASPVSARAVVVGAENRLVRVDEAILVCAPFAVRRRPDELVPAEMDRLVDDLIKGWYFIVRELAILFRARGKGSLVFVLAEAGTAGGRDEIPDLFGAAAAAAFRALAQGLLAASFKESYDVLAFSSDEPGAEDGLGEFVFKTLDEDRKRNTGKWHKYGKGGLFGLR